MAQFKTELAATPANTGGIGAVACMPCLAAAFLGFVPFVLTLKMAPSASFWAEWLAAFAAIIFLLFGWRPAMGGAKHQAAMPVAALSLLAVALLVAAQLLANLPQFEGAARLSIAQALLAAWLCAAASTWRDRAAEILDGFAAGLLAALLLNFVALAIELAGWQIQGLALVASPFTGRASALVGQPNQLATFAVMAWCAAHYLWWRGSLPAWAHGLASVLVAALLASSASRAGSLVWLLAFVLAVLGLRAQADGRTGRRLLWLAALVYVGAQLAWGPGGLAAYFMAGDVNGAVTSIIRQGREGRPELWRDSLQLIAQRPLFGVGWRNFSAARWSDLSTPMLEPNMGHAHNLALNLAVEFGIVGALFILVPLVWALWHVVKAALRLRVLAHDWFVGALLSVIFVYSMLEFPLWYTYFLLPFVLLLGLAAGPAIVLPVGRLGRPVHITLALLALAICVLIGWDYRRIEKTYTDAALSVRSDKPGAALVETKTVTDIAMLTSVDLYAEMMFVRVLAPDGLLMAEKLQISERVVGGLTTKESVARHIAFLLAAGNKAEAEVVFKRAGRNPNLQSEALQVLARLAEPYPALAADVQSLRLLLDQAAAKKLPVP